jgi:hypothetical protein
MEKILFGEILNHSSLYENLQFNSKKKYSLKFIRNILFLDCYLYIDEPFKLKDLIFVLILVLLKKNALIIHNCNKWLNIKYCGKKNYYYYIKSTLRKIILNYTNEIIVVSPFLKDYLKKNNLNKKISYIPFSNKKKKKNSKNNLVYSIPGAISIKKKYDFIFELIKNTNFKVKTELYLLGIPVDEFGKSIISEVEGIKNKNLIIYTFEKRLTDAEFNSVMSKTDYIISDFNKEILTDDNYIEEYGLTKETGFCWLAKEYGCSVIGPQFYNSHHIGVKYLNLSELNTILNINSF